MSLEATGYAQAALGIYLLVLCIFLFHDYYRNAHVLSSKPKGPFANIILYLFIVLTLFTVLLGFFIAFLYNNGFNMVTDETVLDSSYCLRIQNINISWFYFHSIVIFLIISYCIENTFGIPNNNGSDYNFNSTQYVCYRIIVTVLNIYCVLHICFFLHTPPSGIVSTNVEWSNIETGKAFVLCELNIKEKGHIVPLIVLEMMCYVVTAVPLIMRYKLVLSDHKNKDKTDRNEEYVAIIKIVLFYMLISIVFETILLPIFIHETRISGFILSLLLMIRTTTIYCVSTETVSFNAIYVFPIYVFKWIWSKISPLNDAEAIDPNYRWYHKEKARPKKEEIKSNKLSNRDVISGSHIVAVNQDIDDEFNDENSVAFSNVKGASSTNQLIDHDDDSDNRETDTLK